ncbi:MAG TPA: patatin-like phospholipase family protein [Bryobacteraceae bacterium]|nr:patatin-like phospholipase family protein [Bryobacteraceae bacterium]
MPGDVEALSRLALLARYDGLVVREGITLALGGGGMFGAYEAGLWAGLQGKFALAHVFGASIGAFNGLAVAAGCPAQELVDLWLDFREAGEARWRLPWPPWSGCLDATLFHDYLRRHFDRFRPVLPLTVAITRIWPFQPFSVTGADLTWRHLAASCTLPLMMPPCRLAEGYCLDGGIFAAVPAWAAIDAGYERVVAVNILQGGGARALGALKSAICAAGRFDARVSGNRPDERVVWVEPSRRLGPLKLSAKWDVTLARDWIALGREDAPDVLRRIQQWG